MNVTTAQTKIAYTHQHADFEAQNPGLYSLNLMLSGKSFMYLLHLADGRVHAIREYRFSETPDLQSLNALLLQDQFLHEQFNQVTWISDHSRFIVCPEEYLRYEDAENLFAEIRDAWEPKGRLIQDVLPEVRCSILHEPAPELHAILSTHFPEIKYRHVISRTLFQANRIHQQSQPIISMLITAFDGYFCLNILNRTGPVLSQIFTATTADDFLYYLLWSGQHLNISNEHVTLWLSGNFHTKDAVIDLLSKYYQPVKYLNGLTGSPWYAPDTRVPVLHYTALLPEIQ